MSLTFCLHWIYKKLSQWSLLKFVKGAYSEVFQHLDIFIYTIIAIAGKISAAAVHNWWIFWNFIGEVVPQTFSFSVSVPGALHLWERNSVPNKGQLFKFVTQKPALTNLVSVRGSSPGKSPRKISIVQHLVAWALEPVCRYHVFVPGQGKTCKF